MLDGILGIYPLPLDGERVSLYDGDTCRGQGRKLMEEMVIRVDRLSATYGRRANLVQALRDVSLEIRAGEIFGLLGPNGAGKTTLLSCVEGLHKPVKGQVRVGGVDVSSEPTVAQRKLGIQLQHTALLDDLTVAELVQVYSALYEVYLSADQISSLLERFGLSENRNKLARRVSGGQKQRLALALAVANDPQIVLLDEPTSALDPRARRAVWSVIRELHSEGRTIVITTHAMEEAESLCGRVAIMDDGQVIACDTPARLIAGLDASPVLKTNLDAPLDEVQSLPGVRATRYSGQYLEIETSQPQVTLAALSDLALRLGRSIGDVMIRQPNLEDIFLKLTGKQLSA
jgi:ABC-2 type transport system ATP-binding protein